MNRILRGLAYLPTTVPAIGILGGLGWLHYLGKDGIDALTGEISSVGNLLQAVTGAGAAVPGLAAVALALYRPSDKS
jgi:hypothetical protein